MDGVDIRELDLQWLRSSIAMVGQEPVLFELTIAENIAYGLENISQEDMMHAATVANIHHFIQRLPEVSSPITLYIQQRCVLSIGI